MGEEAGLTFMPKVLKAQEEEDCVNENCTCTLQVSYAKEQWKGEN